MGRKVSLPIDFSPAEIAKESRFSHGAIAMMDSILRTALHCQTRNFPLSAGLFASATLKNKLPRTIHVQSQHKSFHH